ncbi:3-keto-5-aminohexanoate cleavage enzyme [Neobacillus rhizosphaerae]|uniref:3-keto-5-aminohexanoate cleavage enzyme n=1 Tax=Neobacillus rhizosphaerae TaxID=2880965 RepID=A0ABN8KVR4_9BACI|nr:3-keto-5-aminohexanoate cleavage protein [Neobacillus rhizosphaerae]CAH2716562.1 3-keto-5-aminohexanoate cleavage enzyme [Neobacillus rhizosphaerae]
MNKLMITAALTGAEVTKEQHPALPVTPEEIAIAAYECFKAGASIIHIHARENDGTPSQNIEIYREIIERIKEKCDVIIQVSTGGAVGMTMEERMQPIFLKPEMATLSTGTVNFGDSVFLNSPNDMEKLADSMLNEGILPEFEIFEVGMIQNALKLVSKRDLKHLHFDFVIGVPGAIPATIENLLLLKSQIPNDATWTVAGIGRHQLPMAVYAMLMGGHVRVGFEDNIFYKKGVFANSNAQLIERIVRIADEIGREIATPTEARKILGLGI